MADDRALLEALRAGSTEALAELFELYSDRMYRLAAGILHDEDEAEGVVQDVFLRLIEHSDRFEGRSSLGTWLYRTTHNACIDRLRRRKPVQPLADEAYTTDEDAGFMPTIFADWAHAPEEVFGSDEAGEVIEEAVQSLPLGLREVFILREVEGLSTAETAEALGISEGAAKVRLHRARLELREALSVYFAEQVSGRSE